MTGVLVGVDGSDQSREALRWAMQEAALRHVQLTAMAVRPAPARPATMVFWGLSRQPESSLDQGQLRKKVEQLVANVVSEIAGTITEVTVNVSTGNPAEELISASREADMLVVGSRGSGGFGRLLMGSVSTQVTHHAACPVVVVPGNR